MMKISTQEYNKLTELVRNTYESCTMERAGFDKIHPTTDDELPAIEKDVTPFILKRTRLYRHSWQLTPLKEALEILAKIGGA